MKTDVSGKRVVVNGAGPGGYPAAFHAADLGMQVTLLDSEPNPLPFAPFSDRILDSTAARADTAYIMQDSTPET